MAPGLTKSASKKQGTKTTSSAKHETTFQRDTLANIAIGSGSATTTNILGDLIGAVANKWLPGSRPAFEYLVDTGAAIVLNEGLETARDGESLFNEDWAEDAAVTAVSNVVAISVVGILGVAGAPAFAIGLLTSAALGAAYNLATSNPDRFALPEASGQGELSGANSTQIEHGTTENNQRIDSTGHANAGSFSQFEMHQIAQEGYLDAAESNGASNARSQAGQGGHSDREQSQAIVQQDTAAAQSSARGTNGSGQSADPITGISSNDQATDHGRTRTGGSGHASSEDQAQQEQNVESDDDWGSTYNAQTGEWTDGTSDSNDDDTDTDNNAGDSQDRPNPEDRPNPFEGNSRGGGSRPNPFESQTNPWDDDFRPNPVDDWGVGGPVARTGLANGSAEDPIIEGGLNPSSRGSLGSGLGSVSFHDLHRAAKTSLGTPGLSLILTDEAGQSQSEGKGSEGSGDKDNSWKEHSPSIWQGISIVSTQDESEAYASIFVVANTSGL